MAEVSRQAGIGFLAFQFFKKICVPTSLSFSAGNSEIWILGPLKFGSLAKLLRNQLQKTNRETTHWLMQTRLLFTSSMFPLKIMNPVDGRSFGASNHQLARCDKVRKDDSWPMAVYFARRVTVPASETPNHRKTKKHLIQAFLSIDSQCDFIWLVHVDRRREL